MTQDPTPSTQPISLAIIGGGIAGLTLAAGLHLNSISKSDPRNKKFVFTLYEARPYFTEIGAGIGLGPNAQRAMHLLHPDILAAYKSCETRDQLSVEERARFFCFRVGVDDLGAGKGEGKGKAGDLIADVRSGGESSVVHRAKFLGELSRLVPVEMTRCGKRCVDVEVLEGSGVEDREGGVLVKFADGTEARHDAVVGCDGVRSVIRRAVLGEGDEAVEPVFSGKCCYRGIVGMEKARVILGEEMAMESQMYLGKGGHVLTTPMNQGQAVNVVAYHTKEDGKWEDETWIKSVTKQEMVARFAGFSQTVRDLIGVIEKPDLWAMFDHPPAKTYHQQGQLCLLGDSAHASTPHHGAAAGMAVEDALVLSKLLGSVECKEQLRGAFAAYDAARRPRSQRLVTSSRRTGRVYDFEDEVVGDDMLALREYLEHAWDWIWYADMDKHLEEAMLVCDSLKESSQPQVSAPKGLDRDLCFSAGAQEPLRLIGSVG
ncbi:uncharacterized protein KY384_008772 [Bacidia gigantensis]|uniref:uncharacterized protein n=1 Tax=Bacidia gigantensis TaxID=2732470 RepID=UPI001D049830|nr:uncharacterized protein KY384_008772 [Bacidia gigantensis]KAG8526571.1 hypothetical protein KY384_008772 [Bacidia gigantensis]